ncbi:hypothetical protein BDB00DRAFT_917918 [Zychaea mexicana]|uniref:uncharacterized protein n=1 Tax=Zychaea mexicana TaxID=64656 RepID=UPI0022FE9E4E|nr:uncharacterized protein BDB00DRAFT_917918 [Zychaea mexicana]KAI9490221.1 hypothetical protein BDB00DRAFT_917918 [Zychaea mexicana]
MTGPPFDQGKRPILQTAQQQQQQHQGENFHADSLNDLSSDSDRFKFEYPAHPYARATDATPNTDSTTVSPDYQNLTLTQGASEHQSFSGNYGYNGLSQQPYYAISSPNASMPMTQQQHPQLQQHQHSQCTQLAPTSLSTLQEQQPSTTASMMLLPSNPLPGIDQNPSPRDESYPSSQQQFELVTESPEYLNAFYNGSARQDVLSSPHRPIESQERMVNIFHKDFRNIMIQKPLHARKQYPHMMGGCDNATGSHESLRPVFPGSSLSSSTTSSTITTTATATDTERALKPSSATSTRATKRGVLAERRHGCPNCSRSFTKHHDLVRHYATHIPESKRIMYPCPDCGNVFFRKDSITRHRGTAACQKCKDRDMDYENDTSGKEPS